MLSARGRKRGRFAAMSAGTSESSRLVANASAEDDRKGPGFVGVLRELYLGFCQRRLYADSAMSVNNHRARH